MTAQTHPFDAAAYLDTPEAVAAYLEDGLQDPEPGEFTEALGVVARARGAAALAEGRSPSVSRALNREGRPEFATVVAVLRSLGLSLHIAPDATPTKA